MARAGGLALRALGYFLIATATALTSQSTMQRTSAEEGSSMHGMVTH